MACHASSPTDAGHRFPPSRISTSGHDLSAFAAFKCFGELVWAACRSEAALYAFKTLNHVFDFHAFNKSRYALSIAAAAACKFDVVHNTVSYIKINFCGASSASFVSHRFFLLFAIVSRVTSGNDTSLSAHSLVIRNAFGFRCF